MTDSKRKVVRFVVALLSGVFVLPELIVGVYLFAYWFRANTTSVYYIDFPYLKLGVTSLLVAAFSLVALFYAATRRSFYGLAFVPAVFFGLTTMIVVPDMLPRGRSMTADSNYLGVTRSNLRSWYDSHQGFPRDEAEIAAALRIEQSLGGAPIQPNFVSFYAQRGSRLPYQISVVNDAQGPRVANVSKRPAVLYYSVSSDYQQFWITITVLDKNVAQQANIKRSSFNDEPFVLSQKSADYLR